MKLRHPRMISLAATVLSGWARLHLATVRFRYHALAEANTPNTPGLRQRFIYTFWHDGLLIPASQYGKFDVHVLISQHADGQLITDIASRLGYKAVRGSTSRGGREAVRQLLALGGRNHIVITPDGPRGPRRQFQPGAIYLSSRSGLPIVPVGVALDRPWRARSWDRFAVPIPFRKAVLVTDAAITVPPEADRDELERYRLLLQSKMDHCSEVAKQIVAGRAVAPLRAAA